MFANDANQFAQQALVDTTQNKTLQQGYGI
jgi:hypothetical protein